MWVALCSTAGFWTCEKKCVAGYSILVQCPLSTHKHIKLVNTQITCISQIKQGIMSNTTGCSPQELLYDILLSWHGLIPPSFNVSAVSPPEKKKKKNYTCFLRKVTENLSSCGLHDVRYHLCLSIASKCLCTLNWDRTKYFNTEKITHFTCHWGHSVLLG